MVAQTKNLESTNTTHKVVIPFYVYASMSFLVSTILLFTSSSAFTQHHFHPNTLAITHTMALGWGTMIILGASHQLVPVLIESKLFSNFLALLSFFLAAVGIPFLVFAFFHFQFDWKAQWGSVLINVAVLCFLINVFISINQSKSENVHAVFLFTATVWLFVTTMIGLLLVYNFTESILPKDSLHYLSLHAHTGVVGWFLLLIIGVGSRLIPMFLISKYVNIQKLWIIYYLINAGLISFILLFFFSDKSVFFFIPLAAVFLAIVLFVEYCYKAYKERIRKQVDEQMKVSLLSVVMMLLPLLILLITILFLLFYTNSIKLILAYGFSIFFGWITAIIFGMTFKTLPFIVWNKIYHHKAGSGKTPNPKDLFNSIIFKVMSLLYVAGFVLFITGVLLQNTIILQVSTVLLIASAVLYNYNIFKMLLHKPAII